MTGLARTLVGVAACSYSSLAVAQPEMDTAPAPEVAPAAGATSEAATSAEPPASAPELDHDTTDVAPATDPTQAAAPAQATDPEPPPSRKFNFNLTPSLLESFSPVSGTHFGVYLSLNTDFLVPLGERGTTLIVSPGFEVGELGRQGLQWGPVFGLIVDQVLTERPKLTVTLEPQVGYFLNAISLFGERGVQSVSHNLYGGTGVALITPRGLAFIPTLTVSAAHHFSADSLALNPMFLVSIPIF